MCSLSRLSECSSRVHGNQSELRTGLKSWVDTTSLSSDDRIVPANIEAARQIVAAQRYTPFFPASVSPQRPESSPALLKRGILEADGRLHVHLGPTQRS